MRGAVTGTGKPTSRCGWLASGSHRLGLGVLLAFTVKGIFTTALIVSVLLAGSPEEDHDVWLNMHVLIWLAVGIGGYATLRKKHGAGDSKPEGRDSPV